MQTNNIPKIRAYHSYTETFFYSDDFSSMSEFWMYCEGEMGYDYELIFQHHIGRQDKYGRDIYEGMEVRALYQFDGHINYDFEVIGKVYYCKEFAQFGIDHITDGHDKGFAVFHNLERTELREESLEITKEKGWKNQ